jgi:hypothetical protein
LVPFDLKESNSTGCPAAPKSMKSPNSSYCHQIADTPPPTYGANLR